MMKKSNQYLVAALGLGAIGAGALYWFLPSLPWWTYAAVGVLIAATGYRQVLRQAADETVVNSKALRSDR